MLVLLGLLVIGAMGVAVYSFLLEGDGTKRKTQEQTIAELKKRIKSLKIELSEIEKNYHLATSDIETIKKELADEKKAKSELGQTLQRQQKWSDFDEKEVQRIKDQSLEFKDKLIEKDKALEKKTSENVKLTKDVRSGRGTLGRLIADESLHREATSLIRDFRQLSNRIQYGSGTISRLINDPEIYFEARRAIRNMNKTAEDVSEATPVSTLAIILGSVFR